MNKIIEKLHVDINLNQIRYNMKKHFNSKFIENINDDKKKLSYGTFGIIYIVKKNNKEYIIKKPLINSDNDLIASKTDSLISSILSSFQEIYLKESIKICPLIYQVFKEIENGKKIHNIVMEKYEGDCFNLFQSMNIYNDKNKDLLIELLKQVSSILLILQNNFKFIHNDLKTNNILYNRIDKSKPIQSDNIIFIISDFGGSNLEINKKKVDGFLFGNNHKFCPAKDLHLLIHIIITYQSSKFKKPMVKFMRNIFDKLDLNNCEINNEKWHNLYQLKEYPNEFEPLNVINKINKLQLE